MLEALDPEPPDSSVIDLTEVERRSVVVSPTPQHHIPVCKERGCVAAPRNLETSGQLYD
jgi:hypothetical protein